MAKKSEFMKIANKKGHYLFAHYQQIKVARDDLYIRAYINPCLFIDLSAEEADELMDKLGEMSR